jgi:SanA protein
MFKKIINAFQNIVRVVSKMLLYLIIGGSLAVLTARAITGLIAWQKTYGEADVPARRVAIVFGAGLTRSGEATPILKDRVETAAKLYFAKKVEKLLMSGDNRFVDYNEPEAMRQYALSLGVPSTDIVLDYAGRRTYDTCYRAQTIFGVKAAILVTQPFHLPRAIFLCNALGMDGVGVAAHNRVYLKRSLFFWNLREIPATLTAFADVLTRPLPVLGKPEPIFPESAQ